MVTFSKKEKREGLKENMVIVWQIYSKQKWKLHTHPFMDISASSDASVVSLFLVNKIISLLTSFLSLSKKLQGSVALNTVQVEKRSTRKE